MIDGAAGGLAAADAIPQIDGIYDASKHRDWIWCVVVDIGDVNCV